MILGQPQIGRTMFSEHPAKCGAMQGTRSFYTFALLSNYQNGHLWRWNRGFLDPTRLLEQDGRTYENLLESFTFATHHNRGIVFGVYNKPIAGVGMLKTIRGLFFLVLNGWLCCILWCLELRVHRPRHSAVIHVFTQTQKDKMSLLSKRTFGLLHNMDQSINSSLLHKD